MLGRLSVMQKMVAGLIVTAVLPLAGLGVFILGRAETALSDATFNSLQANATSKRDLVQAYLLERMDNAKSVALDPTVQQALSDFAAGLGKSGVSGDEYGAALGKYQSYFNAFRDIHDFRDVLLITADGDVVFAAAMGREWCSNLKTGPYKGSDLAKGLQAALGKKIVFQDFAPYAPSDNEPAGFAVSPVTGPDGSVTGAIALQFSTEYIDLVMHDQTGLGQTGEAYLVGPDNLMRSNSRFSDTPTLLKQRVETPAVRDALGGKSDTVDGDNYRGKFSLSAFAPLAAGDVRWALVAEQDVAEALAPIYALRTLVIIAAALAALLSLGFGLINALGITRPLARVLRALNELAKGNLTVAEIRVTARDEIGQLTVAFNQALGSLRSLIGGVTPATEAILMASAELLEVSRQSVSGSQVTAQAIEQVAAAASSQSRTADQMFATVGELQESINQIARGSQETCAEIERASELQTQVVETIGHVAENASAVALSTNQASETARTGARVIGQAVEGMERIRTVVDETAGRIASLAEQSGQIGQISQLIASIAQETNMLALNAAIEAARAGEHGRGFAVVAEEVRRLAESSAKASRDITVLITAIESSTGLVVKAMEAGKSEAQEGTRLGADAGRALTEILSAISATEREVGHIAAIADQVRSSAREMASTFNSVVAVAEENSAASEEMLAGVTEVARSVNDVASLSHENAAAAEEAAAQVEQVSKSAEQVADAARTLADVARSLESQVAKFQVTG